MIADYMLGNRLTVQQEVLQRLKESLEEGWLPYSIICVSLMAMLLADEGQHIRAAELLGLTLNHPASPRGWFDNWPLLIRKQEQLQAKLGTDAYNAAWERGKQLNLDDVINVLIVPELPGTNIAEQMVGELPIEPLTQRELEILRLLGDGLNSREAALRLYLSVGTVRWYLKQVYSKLGAHSRSEAIARARELKLLV